MVWRSGNSFGHINIAVMGKSQIKSQVQITSFAKMISIKTSNQKSNHK